MPSFESNTPELHRRTIHCVRILSLIAVAVSSYLFWITFTHGTVAACGDESSYIACDHVLRSAWSRWLGLPVSLFGCGIYLSIFVASFWKSAPGDDRLSRTAHSFLSGMVTLAVGAALWFLGLQAFVIGKFCLLCTSVHLCGITIGVLLGGSRLLAHWKRQRAEHITFLHRTTITGSTSPSEPLHNVNTENRTSYWSYGIAAIGLMALLSGQIFLPTETTEVQTASEFVDADTDALMRSLDSVSSENIENKSALSSEKVPATRIDDANVDPRPSKTVDATPDRTASDSETHANLKKKKTRKVSFLEGKFQIDVNRHGLLGNPEAEHVIVELVDYTCKDCRRLHQYFKQVRKQYGERLAIVVLPVPLETSCNPHITRTHPSHIGACKYSRLALAVLEIDRRAFHEFHDWLMDSPHPPSLEVAERRAMTIVDKEQLQATINGDGVRKRLRAHVRLFRRVGRFPAMIIRDHIVIGTPTSVADLSRVLAKRLGI